MDNVGIRPRFRIEVSESQEVILARIRSLLKRAEYNFSARFSNEQIILDVARDAAHFWSPQLDFRASVHEDLPGHTVVAGLIGPRPAVWTMFIFFYFLIGVIGFGITTHGVSEWMLGEYNHYVWGLPVAIMIMLSSYFAGKLGERLGQDQIEQFKDFIAEVVRRDLKEIDDSFVN